MIATFVICFKKRFFLHLVNQVSIHCQEFLQISPVRCSLFYQWFMKNCSNLWIYHQLHKTKGEAIIVRKNIPKFNKEKGQIDLLNVFSKKTAKPIQSFCTGLFLVNLEHFQYINLVFLLFILNMNFFIANCLETFVQAFFRNNSHKFQADGQ